MNNQLETTLAPWSQADDKFFRVTAGLLDPHFLQGASVLLASYDADETTPAPAMPGRDASHTPVFVQAPV